MANEVKARDREEGHGQGALRQRLGLHKKRQHDTRQPRTNHDAALTAQLNF